MKRIALILSILLLLLFSCTDNAINPSSFNDKTWEGIFLQYWNVMNEDYVHFSRNDLDWDNVYNKYLQLFKALDYNKQSDSLKAFSYFKEIANNVNDFHYSLSVKDNFGSILSFRPSLEYKYRERTGNSSESFPSILNVSNNEVISFMDINGTEMSKETALSYYEAAIEGYSEVDELDTAFHSGNTPFKYIIEGDLSQIDPLLVDSNWINFLDDLGIEDFRFFFGLTNERVAYFYISQFPSVNALTLNGKTKLYESIENYKALDPFQKAAFDEFSMKLSAVVFDELMPIGAEDKALNINTNKAEDVKGMVLDLRSNGGGNLSFIECIVGCFISSEKTIGKTRYKAGYDRYDYTPWLDMTIKSSFNTYPKKDYQNRFAVILNGASVSSSEVTAIALKESLPNVKIVGTKSYGATCALTDRNLFQSGPYVNEGKTLSIYTTTFQFKTNDGTMYESVGITPDLEIKDKTKTEDKSFIEAIRWVSL